jgi:immune inhibitor A
MARHASNSFCAVSPSPEVLAAIRAERARLGANLAALAPQVQSQMLGLPVRSPGGGYQDGTFYPTPAGAQGLSPAAPARPATRGAKRALVVLVDFPDVPGTKTKRDFSDLLFARGGALSMREYYRQASLNQLDVDGDVFGWLRMPRPLSYYANAQSGLGAYPHNGQKLAEDALAALVATGANVSGFDRDADGHADGFIVVHAGPGAEALVQGGPAARNAALWSHKWTTNQAIVHNGVTFWAYTLQPEDGRVGVFCHEFGHFLGLPDLYDTTGRSEGVGMWCIMGAGSWGGNGDRPTLPCAWARADLGWAAPRPLHGSRVQIVIEPADSTSDAVRLGVKNGGASEYFLAEARRRSGLDAALPGEGLLLWHVDDAIAGNDRPPRYKVGLVQADGAQDLENQVNSGDADDPFPGAAVVKSVAGGAQPSTDTYLRRPSGVRLDDIEFDGTTGRARALATAP